MKTEIENSADLIANEIEAISSALKKLKDSKLSERAIVVLIYDLLPSATYGKPKIGKAAIINVLDAAFNLKDFYLKKQKALKP